ncbi:MAG TPA: carboxylesterase family protein [Planctomycetota bacterium]|jgi:para-nitrobenzyl esterase
MVPRHVRRVCRPYFISALLLIAASSGLAVESDVRKPIQIETGLIEGVSNSANTVVAFKGIPYAAPPAGNLRWRQPQTAAHWDGVRRADSFGASCVQPASTGAPPYTVEFAATGPMSEDCLFLNVWTPARSAKDHLAVLFYIHGGSGTRGSGSVSIYDGEELAKKGIIVVTVNFRLGILGGMGHPQLTAESSNRSCGTYGMLDIIAALKWVQKNIAAFGGDPEKVTICGQSSGAMALHYLTTSPLAKGLFRGAIAVSFPYDYLTKKHSIGNVWQKEQEGLKFAQAKKAASLEDLRKMPASELIANDPAVGAFTKNCLAGGVNTDCWAFPLEYCDALDKGLASDVPILTGITADDFGPPAKYSKTTAASYAAKVPKAFEEKKDAFLALYPATTDQAARDMEKLAQIEYRTASVFYWARRRAKTAKAPVYTYLFDQPISWPEHPEFGAFHSSDLVYEFQNLKKLDRPWTDEDRQVAEQVSSYWVNFIKTGNPNGQDLQLWKPFDSNDPSTMALGTKPGARPIAVKEKMEFYRSVLEK